MMDTQRVAWPSNVHNMPWPKTGITYSYENRGYIYPEKLQRWLERVFGGRDKADYVIGSVLYCASLEQFVAFLCIYTRFTTSVLYSVLWSFGGPHS
jgi:hypothetical protein